MLTHKKALKPEGKH